MCLFFGMLHLNLSRWTHPAWAKRTECGISRNVLNRRFGPRMQYRKRSRKRRVITICEMRNRVHRLIQNLFKKKAYERHFSRRLGALGLGALFIYHKNIFYFKQK